MSSAPSSPPVFETDDLIVLLLGAPGGERPGYLDGVTRLEKLVFLLERETPVQNWLTDKADFRSYKFGPFSAKIYAALDMLVAAQMLTDSARNAKSTEDQWESVTALMDAADVDAYTTRSFQLTERGQRYYAKLVELLPPEAEPTLASFKAKFGGLPLRQLVRYVYKRYPQFTDQSEIRDQILG